MILLGGFTIPVHRLDPILCHTLALAVAEAQTRLSIRITLLSGFAVPLHCLRLILRHAHTISVGHAQNKLSTGIALFKPGLEISPLFVVCLVSLVG